jgi:hypothetical protein
MPNFPQENQAYAPETDDDFLDSELYARHAEIKGLEDLEAQRGTPIPALFNQFYRFVQNPSTVGVETYKRMVDTDDTIGSGVDFLVMCLVARLGRYEHKSEEITEWVNKALSHLDGGFEGSLKEILSAPWVGFSVTETVWQNHALGFIPKKLVTLPPGTIFFETNRTGDLTSDGILQYQRNYNPALSGNGVGGMFGFSSVAYGRGRALPDPYAKLGDFPFPIRSANTYNYMSIRIPKAKCIHYAFDAQGKFGNPYGRSLLRRVYKYYVMKDAFLQMMSVALDRKGTPLTIVYYDPNLTLIDPNKSDAANTGTTQTRGNPGAGIRAGVAAQQAFKNVHNDTTIFLPGKKDQHFSTDFVPQDSNTQSFIEALNFCNKSIMRGLLIPSLIFTGGDGTGSFALGQEHAKTFDKILDAMLAGVTPVLIDQLIKPMIALNFPRSAWEKDGLGSFSKRQLTPDEIQKEMEVAEKGVNMGAIDMNDLTDLNQVRDRMGFQPRTEPIPQPELPGFDEGEGDAGNQGDDPNEPDPEKKPKPDSSV